MGRSKKRSVLDPPEYDVTFTLEELHSLVDALDFLRKLSKRNQRAREHYKKTKKTAESIRETCLYKNGVSEDEIPF